MANASRFGSPRFGWDFFGSELKVHREAAGLTQQALGEKVFCSGSYIGQFATGVRKPQLEIAARIDVVLETGGLFERMCKELINRSPYASYFAEAAHLMGLATSIREHASTFIPGLLQTPDYARAVFLSSFPLEPEERIQMWITGRMEQGRILDSPTHPSVWVVLSESVLRYKVGGAAVMHEQLKCVASLVRKRRVGVQVLPFDAGAPAVDALLTLMTFADAPPVAYTEGPMVGNLLDGPAMVAQAVRLYDLARTAALPLGESLDLIESVAEEYVHECGT
ncbi:helix-turn-helix transcriptional regulator [Streptomyces thioluteus]|uniref:Helix-turn-helix transcriptional regulator n=1 Tax=Streptomyces thioluteus TaxID=66431 RepID=A0ABP6IW83_STRTU